LDEASEDAPPVVSEEDLVADLLIDAAHPMLIMRRMMTAP
jgi:hypothetical protein